VGKKTYQNKICYDVRQPPINNETQQPTKYTRVLQRRDIKGLETIGESRGSGI
jgi:hypothetical protein